MRAAVALSGGVDSLRTAVILKELGYDVFGIHMRIDSSPGGPEGESETRIESREQSLKTLAERFGIPVIVTDLRLDFESLVIQPFMDAYRTGLTPNPCVVCNPRVKFGPLLEKALSLGAKRFATGHYARVLPPESGSNRFRLLRARDLSKDQSYFLFGLSQEQLASVLFPLGDLTKTQVKSWADQSGLSAVIPEESQEICFIPSGDYHEFLGRRTGAAMGSRGPIVDMEGNRLGEHKGVFAYTIGQRRGLGIASDAPLYVVDIDASQNLLRVGRERDLYRSEFTVSNVNWVSVPRPLSPLECLVRIRNRHEPARAGIVPLTDTDVTVDFLEPQRAVTPGQAAVFYEGDLVLGGGIIQK